MLALIAALAVAAGLLIARTRRRSKWTALVTSLASDTRLAVTVQLPQLLAQVNAQVRDLSWTPLEAQLATLIERWKAVTATAPDDQGRRRSEEIDRLLNDLIVAVRAENDALVRGMDWTLLRPRIDADLSSLMPLLTEATAGQAAATEASPGASPPQ